MFYCCIHLDPTEEVYEITEQDNIQENIVYENDRPTDSKYANIPPPSGIVENNFFYEIKSHTTSNYH